MCKPQTVMGHGTWTVLVYLIGSGIRGNITVKNLPDLVVDVFPVKKTYGSYGLR